MDDIYEWLFGHYALPQLRELEQSYSVILDQLAGALMLSQHGWICLSDVVSNMRLQWGTEAFIGVSRWGWP